jgi:PDZ domain-containing protein
MNQTIFRTIPPQTARFTRIAFGLSWILVLPVGIWTVVTYFLPVFSEDLGRTRTWIATMLIAILVALSLAFHVLAHWGVARWMGSGRPIRLTLVAFGEAAQVWPSAGSPWRELLGAAAGPVANLLLAGLAYLLWNAQITPVLNLSALFVGLFNAWLFLINWLPVFPLDGGRLIRALLQRQVRTQLAARAVKVFGWAIAAGLALWGFALILQRARFSWETGLITLLFVLLILDGLRMPAADPDLPDQDRVGSKRPLLAALGNGVLTLVLLAVPGCLLLLNNGLDAPGVALSVEPMVKLPASYRHPHTGTFFLTTVISQTPITAGEWFLGQVTPAVEIVPPEQVVPKNTTPQEQATQNFQMLDTSETTAIAVGLRLAGYPIAAIGRGAQVVDILPESHANGLLEVNDIITAMNGHTVQTTSDLINLVSAQTSVAPVHLQVKRGAEQLAIDVPLLPPQTPGASPRIGIEIQSAGFDYQPPFPVSIITQKIEGGPSAGLMFTLTLYNLLMPSDLTGGRRIAGTGTINLDGTVGPIGGVKQKVFAAEAVGAQYFLCPVDNYQDAVSVASRIKVVKIATAEQAIEFLRSLPPQTP